MPKLKAPLFGLQAHGTLNGELTYTSHRQFHVAKSIPLHPDALSFPQRNHRFLYRLGIALWNGLDTAGRAGYVASAVGRSLTPMNVFLRQWLTSTPNLVFALPLQEGQGSLARDTSPSDIVMDLFGTTWLTDNGYTSLQADGIDDYAQTRNVADLALLHDNLSIIWQELHPDVLGEKSLLQNFDVLSSGYFLVSIHTGRYGWSTLSAGSQRNTFSALNAYPDNIPFVGGLSFAVPTATFYANGQDVTAAQATHLSIIPSPFKARLFMRRPATQNWYGTRLYWIAIFDRTLTPAEHLAIAIAFTPPH